VNDCVAKRSNQRGGNEPLFKKVVSDSELLHPLLFSVPLVVGFRARGLDNDYKRISVFWASRKTLFRSISYACLMVGLCGSYPDPARFVSRSFYRFLKRVAVSRPPNHDHKRGQHNSDNSSHAQQSTPREAGRCGRGILVSIWRRLVG
jgi:hypothetical protein